MKDFAYFLQLAIESVLGVAGIRLYEEPPYAVLATHGAGIEIRRYEPRLAAEVEVPGADGQAGRDEAFRLFFRYIAGANRVAGEPEKVAMTTPVEIAPRGERVAMTVPVQAPSADAVRMRFFLPASYTAATAPVPEDARVRVTEVPAETLAVLRFSGRAGEDEMARRQRELVAGLQDGGWRVAGAPFGYYYDAPFTIPFLRRNEAAVPVEAR